jgi:hypothetical protein
MRHSCEINKSDNFWYGAPRYPRRFGSPTRIRQNFRVYASINSKGQTPKLFMPSCRVPLAVNYANKLQQSISQTRKRNRAQSGDLQIQKQYHQLPKY